MNMQNFIYLLFIILTQSKMKFVILKGRVETISGGPVPRRDYQNRSESLLQLRLHMVTDTQLYWAAAGTAVETLPVPGADSCGEWCF